MPIPNKDAAALSGKFRVGVWSGDGSSRDTISRHKLPGNRFKFMKQLVMSTWACSPQGIDHTPQSSAGLHADVCSSASISFSDRSAEKASCPSETPADGLSSPWSSSDSDMRSGDAAKPSDKLSKLSGPENGEALPSLSE
jgi:hypothetical protein